MSKLHLPPGTQEEIIPDEVVFGASPSMKLVRQKVEKVAGANVPVLIQGESGTGKEIIAHLIHRRSPWATGPFVKVNCPAIPGTLLESELFGYEKGAFTGAYGAKPGRVEMANRGTLFMDEIAEMDLGLQAKLLQVLQDSQFCRIGGREDTRLEARVLCATNRQLEDEIQLGHFRQDLFYRINVVKIQLPPLRERAEDLDALIQYFLNFYSRKYKSAMPQLSPQVLRLLQRHAWPGNIRELANLIERYTILGSEEAIATELLAAGLSPAASQLPAEGTRPLKSVTRQTIQELERKMILNALVAHRWNRKRAAEHLEISYRALLYKIRQAGLPSRRKTGRRDNGSSLASGPDLAEG